MFYVTRLSLPYGLDLLQSRDDGVSWQKLRCERNICVAAIEQVFDGGKPTAGELESGKKVADVERGEFVIGGKREDVAVDAARERRVRSER